MGMSQPQGAPNINVTPLIDVLLVLLVIFLVIIPVMMKVEPVILPPNEPGEVDKLPVAVKLNADATATIDEGPRIMATDLFGQLKTKGVGKSSVVFVDFEAGVPWGDVVSTVDGVRGLVPNPEDIHVAVRIKEAQPAH